jgi:ABC-type phosphate transport system auxiliary subunit
MFERGKALKVLAQPCIPRYNKQVNRLTLEKRNQQTGGKDEKSMSGFAAASCRRHRRRRLRGLHQELEGSQRA